MKKIDVPYISQKDRAATGCESVSTVMMLNWLGYDLSVEDFVDKYLDKKPMDYGPDPYEEFCGDPYDPDSMGCYAPVIQKAVIRVFENEKRIPGRCPAADASDAVNPFVVTDETGRDLEDLLDEFLVKNNMPLITWCTIDFKDAIIGPVWKLHDGTDFVWKSNEHCALVTGFDDNHIIVNDPWNDNGIMYVDKAHFIHCYKEQDMRAVGIKVKQAPQRL